MRFSILFGALLSVSSSIAIAQTADQTHNTFKNSLHIFTVDAKAHQADEIKDPLATYNRYVYRFNDRLDAYLLKPVAIQYEQKVPEDVRSSYTTFRKNLGEPWNAVNQLIRGEPKQAAKSLGRFAINTLTSLGFADPARRLGLERNSEDFATTLGYYGVPSGAYIMLPVFGPSTVRDGLSMVVDRQARPQNYLIDDTAASLTLLGIQAVDVRSQLLGLDQTLPQSVDLRYAAIRDAYLQKRAFDIAEKKGEPVDNAFIEDIDAIDEDAF